MLRTSFASGIAEILGSVKHWDDVYAECEGPLHDVADVCWGLPEQFAFEPGRVFLQSGGELFDGVSGRVEFFQDCFGGLVLVDGPRCLGGV